MHTYEKHPASKHQARLIRYDPKFSRKQDNDNHRIYDKPYLATLYPTRGAGEELVKNVRVNSNLMGCCEPAHTFTDTLGIRKIRSIYGGTTKDSNFCCNGIQRSSDWLRAEKAESFARVVSWRGSIRR